MLAIDTNILVYAHRRDAPMHQSAFKLMKDVTSGVSSFGIPFHCLVEFYSVVTHSKVYTPPSSQAQAIDQIEAWLECPRLRILCEDNADSWLSLKATLLAGRVTGPRVHDARIASVCLAHDVTLFLSADRDFGRFASLKVKNPLVG